MPVAAKPELTREERIALGEQRGYRYAYNSLFPPVYDMQGKPRGQMPDWMVEAHCCRAKQPFPKRLIIKEGQQPKEWLGFVDHLKNFVSVIWHEKNPILAFEWNWNAETIVEELFIPERKFLGIAGHKSCVHGDTGILDPITGEEPTIQWLSENQLAPTVMTLRGPERAEVPFLKGEEELFEVALDDGSTFKCTGKHRVLTPSGFLHTYDLSVGDSLVGYAHDPLASTLGTGPSTHASDAHCSLRTTEGSQFGCHPSPRFCGGQPPYEEGICQSPSPSQDDAQGCTSCTSDDLDAGRHKSQCTHPCSPATRRPTANDPPLPASHAECESLHFSSETEQRDSHLFSQDQQYSSKFSPLEKDEARSPGFSHTQSSSLVPYAEWEFHSDGGSGGLSPHPVQRHQQCDGYLDSLSTSLESSRGVLDFSGDSYGLTVTNAAVVSIKSIGKHKFYDLTVPRAHHYFAEGAIHHNSSKTETLAVVAVALFLISPSNTKCIMTAKTLKAAKGRNWGRMILAWQAAIHFFGNGDMMAGERIMPGALKEGIIEFRNGEFKDATRGIELIAFERGNIQKASDKIVGAKQVGGTLFVNAEELATLPHGLVEICRDNLAVNEGFKFAGPFNPRDPYDGAMLVSKPKDGWESITVDDDGWETDLGYCIHFDGLKSPNVLAKEGDKLWKGLYSKKDLEWDEKTHHGQNTPEFWQFTRGFWSPTGALNCIYSGQEITSYLGDKTIPSRECVWLETPIKLAGLDPAYVGGGDRAAAYFAELGWAHVQGQRKFVLCYTGYVILAADVTKGHDKPRQVAESFKEECEKRGVPIKNAGVDVTGAASFASLLRMIWGDGFLEVNFAESASDAPISDTDSEDADAQYVNKRAQLWYSGKPLLRSGQLKGIGMDLASELVTCMYKVVGGKTIVEKKEDMKKRTGFSPDLAESALICLSVAIERLGLVSTEKAGSATGSEMDADEFLKWAEQIAGARCKYLEFEAA